MRKTALLLLLLVCAECLHAQGKKIYVYKDDGSVLTYDLDAISTITFNRDTSKWPRTLLRVFYDSSMQEYATNQLDSLTVTNDPKNGLSLIVSFGIHCRLRPKSRVKSLEGFSCCQSV